MTIYQVNVVYPIGSRKALSVLVEAINTAEIDETMFYLQI